MYTVGKHRFFLFIFFILSSACQRNETLLSSLTRAERADLYYLFREIIDNESGAYVLLGSKPLCTAYLEVKPKRNGRFWRHPDNGWAAWGKIKPLLPMSSYLLVRKPFTFTVTAQDGAIERVELQCIIFANIKRTSQILSDHYDLFRSLTGVEFSAAKIVYDLEDSNSPFWNQIFDLDLIHLNTEDKCKKDMACGLLFGFGDKNAAYFALKSRIGENEAAALLEDMHPRGSLDDFGEKNLEWANFLYELGLNTFLIPGFVSYDGGQVAERYKKERTKIQSAYRGRDFMEVTVALLSR